MTINNYIVDFETFNKVKNNVNFGEKIGLATVRGDIAMELAMAEGLKINDRLLKECDYIFRFNKKGTHLCALRVSMHPKTIANLEKGSKRFGSLSILNELH